MRGGRGGTKGKNWNPRAVSLLSCKKHLRKKLPVRGEKKKKNCTNEE